MRAADELTAAMRELSGLHDRPVIVALDGGSGAGKSTIVAHVQRKIDVAHVPLDDFYQTVIPESALPDLTVEERFSSVFEWNRVREEALLPLLRGEVARWRPFDFFSGPGDHGTYGLRSEPTTVVPAPVVLLEGAYSASPPLEDLVDLAVLARVPAEERHRRVADREDPALLRTWHAIWDDVEAYYFDQVRPPESFDLVLSGITEGRSRSSDPP